MATPVFAVALGASNWYGIYYAADTPTITITCLWPAPGAQIGANSWWVNNMKGVLVAHGTVLPTATSITVATSGTWASGGTVGVGHYQFYTDTTSPGVTGGGVAVWNQSAAPQADNDVEEWWGVVTASGAQTLTGALSNPQLWSVRVDDFQSTNGTGTTWTQAAAATQDNTASTTIAFPSLTGAAGDLYVGAAFPSSMSSSGATSGFVYNNTNPFGSFCYNVAIGSGAIAPTSTQGSSGLSSSAGVILAPSAGTVSHVGAWTTTNGSGGLQHYAISVSPVAVGDVLVLQHVRTAGNGVIPPTGQAQGCFFQVCPATQMFDPVSQGWTHATSGKINTMSAWAGVGQYRTAYTDSVAAATIAATFAADPCFNGAWLDTARPYVPWLSSTTQSSTNPAWATTVGNMVTAGLTGWAYELPSNEPENSGQSQATTITNYISARTAVLGADATAKCMAWCSAGVPESSSYTKWAAILAGVTFDHASRHSENSVTNLHDIYTLRQDLTQIAAGITASGTPHAILWDTETGMSGCYFGCYHPRRHAAQVTKFLMVRESFGWRKEFCYTYDTLLGSGNPQSGFVESPTSSDNGVGGSVRMGAYAAHIMSEALYGTTCSPTAKPGQLSFGSAGSIGDVFFFGLHYTSTARDVVVLATNGIGFTAGETVTLNVSSSTGMVVWDGEGHDITSTCTVSGSQVTIPVDDLLTYVFLPTGVTVTVADTGSKVISVLNAATNVIGTASSLINEASTAVTGLGWGNNWGVHYNLPGSLPYSDATIPATVTASGWGSGQSVIGYAVKSTVPWNNGPVGYSAAPIAFTIKTNGSAVVATINNATAVSVAVPGSPCYDTASRTTYWDHAYAWLGTFVPQAGVTSIQLEVTATSYDGEPDAAAADFKFSGSFPTPVFNLADFAIMQGTGGTTPPVTTSGARSYLVGSPAVRIV